jgi:hypothetical protein
MLTEPGSTAGPTASFSIYIHGPGSYSDPLSASAITCVQALAPLAHLFNRQQIADSTDAGAVCDKRGAVYASDHRGESISQHHMPWHGLPRDTPTWQHWHMHA